MPLAGGAVLLGLSLGGCNGTEVKSAERAQAERAARQAAIQAAASRRFRSRRDLVPPKVSVRRREEGRGTGLLFVGPKTKRRAQNGAMIVDDNGELVWWRPVRRGWRIYDFRVQQYRGKPVLTWWEGRSAAGHGEGVGQIYDMSYRRIATVRAAGRGMKMDQHEFLLTPRGTALILVYRPKRANLRPAGGRRNGQAWENVVQEIDIRSGRLRWQWSSLPEIPIRDTYHRVDPRATKPFDYLHLNSIDVLPSGDLLVGARRTSAVYRISRKRKRVVWRLGGRRSNFRMGNRTRFVLPHDARVESDGHVRIFDNRDRRRRPSRVIVIDADRGARRARLVRRIGHPERLFAATQANAQRLPNGNVLVGWGSRPVVSEHLPGGRMVLDLRLPRGYDSYRAFRSPWVGRPYKRPALTASRSGGSTTAYVSWNGATEVARWRLLVGAARDALQPAGEPAPRRGFETRLRAASAHRFAAVQALDAAGAVIGRSRTVEVR